jgi:hypothetical protein
MAARIQPHHALMQQCSSSSAAAAAAAAAASGDLSGRADIAGLGAQATIMLPSTQAHA